MRGVGYLTAYTTRLACKCIQVGRFPNVWVPCAASSAAPLPSADEASRVRVAPTPLAPSIKEQL